MKNIFFLFGSFFLFSCTSNTILEKPKDLIPKDSMIMLIEEMMVASSSKYINNKFQEINVNYMSLVYETFKVDSIRFQNSNLYYMSKIDDYQKILEVATKNLEAKKELYAKQKTKIDSINKLKTAPKVENSLETQQ